MKVMNFSEANCHQCYKCVRTCKVKAIKIEDNQAHIIADKCIACGQCFASCPQNARNIHSDVGFVKKLINSQEKVTLSVAPSFRGFYESSDRFTTALRRLGFSKVEETAVGADITSKLYRDYIRESRDDLFITTCCPSVVLLIEKYFPEVIPYVIPYMSPMMAHGNTIKREDPKERVVFLGPCISKKCESLTKKHAETIDAVLTFDEVSQWLALDGIDYHLEEESKCDRYGSASGSSYPVVGGILDGIKDVLEERKLTHMRVDGVDECMEIFQEIINGNLRGACIEVSACRKSCLGGPSGSRTGSSAFSRVQKLKKYLQKQEAVAPEKTIDLSTIENHHYSTSFADKKIVEELPSEKEIRDILISLEKRSIEDELNCGGCGYETCREKAISIYKGMSHADMCIHYVKKCSERISNEIFENSPNAILILDGEKRIVESNMAFSRFFGLAPFELKGHPLDNFEFLNKVRSLVERKENILWEKVSFTRDNLHMMVSVIPMDSREDTLLIFTDVTKEVMRKEEIRELKEKTLEITQEVIEKQMRVVQEIAGLLGETTAETKVALNKVKDVFNKEESL